MVGTAVSFLMLGVGFLGTGGGCMGSAMLGAFEMTPLGATGVWDC